MQFAGSGVPFPDGVEGRLLKAGITSSSELMELNERELGSKSGIGTTTVSHVVEALAEAGLSLARDPYEPYECARDSRKVRDAELRSYFLCDVCRDAYTQQAFDGREPEWVSSERPEGYCCNCNERGSVGLSQWFLCGTCDRVMRSIGRGRAAAKFVAASWAEAFRGTSALSLRETDPIELRRRGRRSDADRVATADFVAELPDGEAVLGVELKSGRSALPGGGIGAPMRQFQLDTTDCDDISVAAVKLDVPVFLLHAQVIGRAHAPTERFDGVGLWFARPWALRDTFDSVQERPTETRDAAYFKTGAFRPFTEFPAYLKEGFEADLESMRSHGFPELYPRHRSSDATPE